MTVIADVFEHCVYCETSLPRATSTCRCQQISLLWSTACTAKHPYPVLPVRAVVNKSVYSGGDSTGMTVIADVFEHCVYCETSVPRATSTCRYQQISLLWR
ncbi:hypothetical protein J6590_067803 [Homalodisca vitripennis]|nr:hypothetical protein J6590_067803 [Homalodisca vitripennis]